MTSKSKSLKLWFPKPIHKSLSFLRRRGWLLLRWIGILLSRKPDEDQIYIFYGHDHIPNPNENATGGIVKFQRMQDIFPNAPRRFNTLYLGSGNLPRDWQKLIWLARLKGVPILYNQNGVGFPAWHGPGWERFNMSMIKALQVVDHVFYQSQFCKLSADRFLGERRGRWEILHNAIDTSVFTPAKIDPDSRHLVLLLGGQQHLDYPLEAALYALSIAVRERRDVRLLVTGQLSWSSDEEKTLRTTQQLIAELDIGDYVDFYGSYTQQEAPQIFRKAHLLLHPKCNDACPNTVIEAMACGLPVVYCHSGGVPELVGCNAGVGIPNKSDWERVFPPDPQALAEAVLTVAEQRKQYAEAARQRAVEKFDLQPWVQRHKEVIEELLN